MGEIGLGMELGFEGFEVGEFFSVVEGDGFDEGAGYFAEGVYDRAGYGVGSSVLDFTRQEVAVFAFDQGEDGRPALSAQNEVGFPIAGTASAMDDPRAQVDAHAAGQQAAPFSRSRCGLGLLLDLCGGIRRYVAPDDGAGPRSGHCIFRCCRDTK